jgi:AP-3 complex subunit delta-1
MIIFTDVVADSSRLPTLREPLARAPSSTFVVEKVGEMPARAVSPAPRSAASSPAPASSHAMPRPALSFPEYVVEDGDTRASTPEPIKVMRAKKKGGTSGKSKRTKTKESTAPTE